MAEAAGFDEVWLGEDFFFSGGIAAAGIALAETETLDIGLGVASAVVRHPALLAMEVAAISRAYPGRFTPGIGLGVPGWMRQMGLLPRSPLTAVRECTVAVKRLLAGERLTETGALFAFDGVALEYPAHEPVPVRLGMIGPKGLELAGEVGDGSILSVAAGTDYIRWARERVDAGRRKAGRTEHHPITVFAIYAVDPDGEPSRAAARSRLAYYRAAGGPNALTDVVGISDELADMIARGGAQTVEAEMPDEWVEDLTVAGTPTEAADKIARLLAAGADSVALLPAQHERVRDTIELTSSEVLSRL
jgi:5,10-methylenetetrahydromethanopterin reductase